MQITIVLDTNSRDAIKPILEAMCRDSKIVVDDLEKLFAFGRSRELKNTIIKKGVLGKTNYNIEIIATVNPA